jgi:MFS family permease
MGSPSDFDMQYALLFSLYSFPNIFLPLFGGYFVDKYGAIPCLLFFQFAIFVGSIFFAVGVAEKSWPLMFVGRMIFGIGGENIQVSSATTTANYFEGKEIALAFGIYLCTGSVGVTLCNIASPEIMDSMSIEFAVWMG